MGNFTTAAVPIMVFRLPFIGAGKQQIGRGGQHGGGKDGRQQRRRSLPQQRRPGRLANGLGRGGAGNGFD